jgi:hypothetical protein
MVGELCIYQIGSHSRSLYWIHSFKDDLLGLGRYFFRIRSSLESYRNANMSEGPLPVRNIETNMLHTLSTPSHVYLLHR